MAGGDPLQQGHKIVDQLFIVAPFPQCCSSLLFANCGEVKILGKGLACTEDKTSLCSLTVNDLLGTPRRIGNI